jgi:hypothetical protein
MNTTGKKLKTLIENNEDFEWYPTTDEILSAMNYDLHRLFTKYDLARNDSFRRRNELFNSSWNYDPKTDERRIYTAYDHFSMLAQETEGH